MRGEINLGWWHGMGEIGLVARHEGRDCSGGKNCPAWRCGPGLCLVESVTKREGHEPKLLAGKTGPGNCGGMGSASASGARHGDVS